MSTPEPSVGDRSEEPAAASIGQAVMVVTVLTVIAALVVLTLAFSGSNTPSSIDGRTATTSQHAS